MGIRKYNPTSPGVRGMTVSTFEEITTATPEKSLTTTLKKNAGRNFRGKITVRHRGGGARRKYRIIDFKRNKDGVPGKVSTIEYDPNTMCAWTPACPYNTMCGTDSDRRHAGTASGKPTFYITTPIYRRFLRDTERIA